MFCAKHAITGSDLCDSILARVNERLDVGAIFLRRVVLIVPITAPDTRKLQLIIREGEQHDLYQFVGDFFELYGMSANSVGGMVAEVNKRLAGRIMFIIIFALRRMEPSGIPSPPLPKYLMDTYLSS